MLYALDAKLANGEGDPRQGLAKATQETSGV